MSTFINFQSVFENKSQSKHNIKELKHRRLFCAPAHSNNAFNIIEYKHSISILWTIFLCGGMKDKRHLQPNGCACIQLYLFAFMFA